MDWLTVCVVPFKRKSVSSTQNRNGLDSAATPMQRMIGTIFSSVIAASTLISGNYRLVHVINYAGVNVNAPQGQRQHERLVHSKRAVGGM
jgi:hypothetical protein